MLWGNGNKGVTSCSVQIQSVLEGGEPMEDEGGLSSNPDELVALIDETESKINTLQAQVAEEVVKMDKYKVSADCRALLLSIKASLF